MMDTDLSEATVDDQMVVYSGDDLSIDVLANILGFLCIKDIFQKRRVCKKWKEAAKMTIVPLTDFYVDSVENYNTMRVMTEAMPNLQQITIGRLEYAHKYSDGEDPDESIAAAVADWTSHDFEIVSNFSKLSILEICDAGFNGSYPFLFNSFPLLQKLSIKYTSLKFDLEMLAELSLLKELECTGSSCLAGNISSLRVLKDTLEKVKIHLCARVEGNLMDLANFPRLKELDLCYTAVTGDIRDIGSNDFSSLEHLVLPKGVYGGNKYELQRISDATDVVRAVYLFKKQRPMLKMNNSWWCLSEGSPDCYEAAGEDEDADSPPFYVCFVEAGSRVGYRWETVHDIPCEVNWLDPEPDRESSDYDEYIEDLQAINSRVHMFRGFYQPPTEEEYHRLWEAFGDD